MISLTFVLGLAVMGQLGHGYRLSELGASQFDTSFFPSPSQNWDLIRELQDERVSKEVYYIKQ